MVAALPLARWGQELFGDFWGDALLRLGARDLFLMMLFSSLLCLFFGNGILKGRNWARVLALAYCVVATLIAAAFYRAHPFRWVNLMGDVAITVTMWFFLYRPEATAFFKGEELHPGHVEL